MHRFFALILILFSLSSTAQTRIATWTQPVRNLPSQAALGVNTVWGPEIESGSGVTAQQWCDAAKAASLSVITKNQTFPVPSNCVGFWHPQDEPNKTPPLDPAVLKPEYDRLHLLAPNLPVYISLAGDKVVYPNFPNPQDRAYYLKLSTVCDRFTVNFYSANRSNKYPMSMTATAVKNIIALTGKPVDVWIECNDQELSKPVLPEVNGAPTPDQITEQVTLAMQAGASGFGWFGVCSRAAPRVGWPAAYWPPTDRNGVSMQPQYDRCREIALKYNPPVPTPPIETKDQEQDRRIATLEARLQMIGVAATTQPTTKP